MQYESTVIVSKRKEHKISFFSTLEWIKRHKFCSVTHSNFINEFHICSPFAREIHFRRDIFNPLSLRSTEYRNWQTVDSPAKNDLLRNLKNILSTSNNNRAAKKIYEWNYISALQLSIVAIFFQTARCWLICIKNIHVNSVIFVTDLLKY